MEWSLRGSLSLSFDRRYVEGTACPVGFTGSAPSACVLLFFYGGAAAIGLSFCSYFPFGGNLAVRLGWNALVSVVRRESVV